MIRAAHQGDVGSLVHLLEYLFNLEEDFSFDEKLQARGVKLLIESPGAILLVAEKEKNIVGMVSGQRVISTAEGGPALLMEDLVVTADWQNQGIGSALLLALETWATTNNINRIQLLADRNNHHALSFYKNHDWLGTKLICLRRTL